MKKLVLIFLLLFCINLISSATIGSSNSKGVIISSQVQSSSSNGDTNNYYVGGVNASTTTCSGTDKISSYNNATGVFTCTADSGGGGVTTIVQGQPLVIRQMNPLSTNNNTIWSGSDLQFNLVTGTRYFMICDLLYTGQATSTGLVINLTNNATVSNVNNNYDTWSSNTAKVGFSSTVFNTALTGTGSGGAVIYTSQVMSDFMTTSNGVFRLLFRSEVSGSTIQLERGSKCELYNVSGYSDQPTKDAVNSIPAIKRQSVNLPGASATIWNMTNLTFDVFGGTQYNLNCDLLYTSAAATTGMTINLTNTGSSSNVNIMYDTWSSATAKVGLSQTAFYTALIGTGSGTAVIYYSKVVADFNQTSNGVLSLMKRSEIDTSLLTLVNGSTCKLYNVTI